MDDHKKEIAADMEHHQDAIDDLDVKYGNAAAKHAPSNVKQEKPKEEKKEEKKK